VSPAALAVAAVLAAPTILAPGPGAQTVRDEVRLLARAGEGATVSVGGGPPVPCAIGGARADVAHCRVALEVGANRVVVHDAGGAAEVVVLRYETLGRHVGADLAGFGAGTVHRAEVEAGCAGCHAMDLAAGLAHDARLPEAACGTCHPDVTARPLQHGPVGGRVCFMCHDPASAPQRYAVAWPIQETCFRCHADIQGAMTRKAWRHGPAAAGRCTTCHDPHGSRNVFWLKKPIFDLCTNCHAEKAKGRHVVLGFVYGDGHPLKGRPHPIKPGVELACSSCHNPHAAQVRFLWQFDATVREELCRTCHPK
jgi:predicted CXXCH cytochrome family protein